MRDPDRGPIGAAENGCNERAVIDMLDGDRDALQQLAGVALGQCLGRQIGQPGGLSAGPRLLELGPWSPFVDPLRCRPRPLSVEGRADRFGLGRSAFRITRAKARADDLASIGGGSPRATIDKLSNDLLVNFARAGAPLPLDAKSNPVGNPVGKKKPDLARGPVLLVGVE